MPTKCYLVGKTTEAGRNLTWEKQLRARDAVQMQATRILMKRMAAILEYDEDTGPQVQYKSEQTIKRLLAKSKRARTERGSSQNTRNGRWTSQQKTAPQAGPS